MFLANGVHMAFFPTSLSFPWPLSFSCFLAKTVSEKVIGGLEEHDP